MRDWVELEGIEIEASVGILGWEAKVCQPLQIDLRMGLDLEPAALSEQIGDTVDYGMVTSLIEALVGEGHWWLLESLARTVAAAVLCAPQPSEQRPRVAAVEVRIRKPKVLYGRAVPGVRIARVAEDFTWVRHSLTAGVIAEPLHVGEHTSVVRLGVGPGATVALPASVALLLLGGTLQHAGEALQAGARLPRGEPLQLVAGPDGATLMGIATGRWDGRT